MHALTLTGTPGYHFTSFNNYYMYTNTIDLHLLPVHASTCQYMRYRQYMLYDDHQAEVNGRHVAATTSLQL